MTFAFFHLTPISCSITGLFLYPLKTLENREYRNKQVARNELNILKPLQESRRQTKRFILQDTTISSPFHINALFLYSQKISKNQGFQ